MFEKKESRSIGEMEERKNRRAVSCRKVSLFKTRTHSGPRGRGCPCRLRGSGGHHHCCSLDISLWVLERRERREVRIKKGVRIHYQKVNEETTRDDYSSRRGQKAAHHNSEKDCPNCIQ